MTLLKTAVFRSGVAAGSIAALASVALAAEPATNSISTSEACTKSVNAIGASMSHSEKKTPDGRTAFQFVVRTNGVEYNVTCDPATGVVGDISPRSGGTDSPL